MDQRIYSRFFLTIHDRICCMLSATILLPMSLFVIATTIRQLSSISSTEDIYIVSIKSLSAISGILTAILSIFVSIACPYRRISITTIVLSTISAFGIMMSLATIFFHANWTGHHESVSKVVFIITSSLCLVCSIIITIRIALRFKSQCVSDSTQTTFLEQCSIILATLLIIASFTSISGFIMGYIIKWQLLLDKIFGGGLHSGIMGLLTSLVFLAAIYGGPKSRFSLLSISMGVSILALISLAVSYYTEEIEIDHSIQFISRHQVLFFSPYYYRKVLLMTKSTLILISSIFGLVFGTPLTVATCCLLKRDLLIQPELMNIRNDFDLEFACSANFHQHSNLHRMPTPTSPLPLKSVFNNSYMSKPHFQPSYNSIYYQQNPDPGNYLYPQCASNHNSMKEDVCDLLKEIEHNKLK